VRGEPEVGI